MEEVFKHTFKAMRKQLDEQRAEGRRLWQQRLGTASEFCRAVVSNGYLSEKQMQRAAQRYRLGASRDGGVTARSCTTAPTVTATTTANRHGLPTCCGRVVDCQRTGTMTIVCLGCTY